MSTTAYQIKREGNEWGPKNGHSLNNALEAIRTRLKNSPNPYRLRRPDSEGYGPTKSRPEIMTILEKNLPKSGIGDVWKIKVDGGEGVTFSVKKIRIGLPEKAPAFSLWGASPKIVRVARVSAAYDSGVDCAGIKVTRRIAGTSSWSQHSAWPRLSCNSNAIDLMFRLPLPVGNDLPRQRRLVSYLLNNSWELDLNMIISERTYWSRANNFQPRYYSGISHVSHTHIEIFPSQTGWPCS